MSHRKPQSLSHATPSEVPNPQDPLVVFTPSGRRGRVAAGTAVLDAARQLGVDLDSVCGGRGICSKCQIAPAFGQFAKHGITSREDALSAWNATEQRYADKRGLAKGRRLGCQARILRDVVIDVPPESQLHRQVIRKSASARAVAMEPSVRLCFVEVAAPDMHAPSGHAERVAEALEAQWQIPGARPAFAALAGLQQVVGDTGGGLTVALHSTNASATPQIIAAWRGLLEGDVYGVAVDVGSTTIAAHLVSLRSGEVAASAGRMNPQIRFGEDLMSRVSYAMMNPGGGAQMTAAVREALNELIAALAADAGIGTDRILDVTLVGNPVMHHLLLGLDPTPLGQAPFALASASALDLSAAELGLTALPAAAQVYLLPLIAGHVGADAAAVALAEDPGSSEDLVLIVDVGTNAEILLGDRSRVLACSSPTGPAFEGAQISAGQRAAPGAIEAVRIDPTTKEPRFRVVGCPLWSDEAGFDAATAGTGVTGICGSGIIEAVAEMRMAGLLDARGLIGSAAQTGSARMIPDGRTHGYLLHDASASGGPRILVTQADVRAIQLAKAALYAGARLLMDERGVDTVDRVVLAGAFGAHISPRHALVLGMIPDVPPERVSAAGNAAGTGAHMALCSLSARRRIEAQVRAITKVETAVEPRFQEHFVAASAIPHAQAPFAALRAVIPLPEPQFNAGDGGGRRRRGRGQASATI